MRGHAVRCLIASLLLAGSFANAIPAVAQDSDGPLSGAETDWLGVPPPDVCTIEPVTIAEFVDALETDGSEVSGVTLPLQVASEDELPNGEPVDDEVIEGISATLWEATACLNGGDLARFLALFNPMGLQWFSWASWKRWGGHQAHSPKRRLPTSKPTYPRPSLPSPNPFHLMNDRASTSSGTPVSCPTTKCWSSSRA